MAVPKTMDTTCRDGSVQARHIQRLHATTAYTDDTSIVGLSPLNWAIV